VVITDVRPYLAALYTFVQQNNLTTDHEDQFVGNKVSLVHRIYDLARSMHPFTSKVNKLYFSYFTSPDKAQKIADTRNYYIHFSDNKRSKAWKQEELYQVNSQLHFFIRIVFMKWGFINNNSPDDKPINNFLQAIDFDTFY
jgi:hypothetical protein